MCRNGPGFISFGAKRRAQVHLLLAPLLEEATAKTALHNFQIKLTIPEAKITHLQSHSQYDVQLSRGASTTQHDDNVWR